MRNAIVGAAVVLASVAIRAEVNTSPKARLAAAARVVRETQAAIPADYWNKARCVVVLPELKNDKFVPGGKYSRGVASCRIGDRWSAPAFVDLGKGNRMFQLGAQTLDLVLLVMNEGALQKLSQQTVTLGADASVAPGPIDTQPRVDLTTLRADILTYSRAKGLAMNLAGGALKADEDANGEVYGKGSTLGRILASRDLSAPTEASAFIAALSSQPAATAR